MTKRRHTTAYIVSFGRLVKHKETKARSNEVTTAHNDVSTKSTWYAGPVDTRIMLSVALLAACSSGETAAKPEKATEPAPPLKEAPLPSAVTADAAPAQPPGPTPGTVRFAIRKSGRDNELAEREIGWLTKNLTESGFDVNSEPLTEEGVAAADRFAAQELPELPDSWKSYEYVVVTAVTTPKKRSQMYAKTAFEGTAVVLKPPSRDPLLYYRFDRGAFDERDTKAFLWVSSVMKGEDESK